MSERVLEVVVGSEHSCARLSSGRVRCWGANAKSELGDGTSRDRYWPRDVVGVDDAVDLDARRRTTCAVLRSGEVACWGEPLRRTKAKTDTPDRSPRVVPGIADAIAVSLGDGHGCARLRGGGVACWGHGEFGELGDGKASDSGTAVAVDIEDATEISAGDYFTCALTKAGETKCWGLWSYGALGLEESQADRCHEAECASRPKTATHVPPLVSISAGSSHVCGVRKDDGAVVCWGMDSRCQTGSTIEYSQRTRPVAVPELTGARFMASPQCAVDDGGLTCWGTNEWAQREYRREDECSPHVRYAIDDVTSASIGRSHSCASVGDESVRCWGEGMEGQLGHGSRAHSAEPVEVAGLRDPNRPDVDELARLMSEVKKATLSGFALMWADATVYSAARADAAVGAVSESGALDRFGAHTGVVEIVADHGEFVEVSGLTERKARSHCGGSPVAAFDQYDLTFFLRREDLAPVLATEYADSHDDGSAIVLAPGTPVTPSPSGVGVYVGRYFVQTYLDSSDVARSYQPAAVGERTEAWTGPRQPVHGLTETSLLGRQTKLGRLPEELLRRWTLEDDDGQLRIVLADRCVRIEMLLDQEPKPGGMGGHGRALGRSKTIRVWRIPSGTEAFWPDGNRAGTLREGLRRTSEPTTVGGRRCWSVGPSAELCHDPATITEAEEEDRGW